MDETRRKVVVAVGAMGVAATVGAVAAPDQSLHIRQGVEMKRPSDIFVRAGRDGDNIVNIRGGGYAVQTMEGEIVL